MLRRHGCLTPSAVPGTPLQRFEHSAPNQLWQVDVPGPLAFPRGQPDLFEILDDHSRFALAWELVADQTLRTAWDILWRRFGDVGLPDRLLCDHALAATGGTGRSWFDARLIRLGIRPAHGRPYHPQPQGKMERWHGPLEGEVFPRVRWDDPASCATDLRRWRVEGDHALRPHEAWGDQPPVVLDRGFITSALWATACSPEGDPNKAPVEAWRGRGLI